MTTAIPDLWPESLKPVVLSPVAILRTQAARLKERTNGLLEAEIQTKRITEPNGDTKALHVFEIVAPAMDGYRFQVLSIEHPSPGAYPVDISSFFLPTRVFVAMSGGRNIPSEKLPNTQRCANQDAFQEALKKVFSSQELSGILDSLIAQILDKDIDADSNKSSE
jgi:hypothetical protein